MKITVKKGLDIPIAGKPAGPVKELPKPQHVALNLTAFDELRFRLLTKVGERVQIGQPLVENKGVPGQMFVSPGGGVVSEIRRGHKRQLGQVIIQLDAEESFYPHTPLDPEKATREELIASLMSGGLFPHIRLRPFNLIPDARFVPRDIFVTAVESRPFEPPLEMQVEGYENYFQAGLTALSRLTPGKVHLVSREKSVFAPFVHAQHIEKHTIEGPHPAGSSSLHIHQIAPIRRPDDHVWALTALDAVILGRLVTEGRYQAERVIAIAGNGVIEEKRGYFRGRSGYPIEELMAGRVANQLLCLISGNPLTGHRVDSDQFLGFDQSCFSIIPENSSRERFHFLSLGLDKYSASRAYLSGHIRPPKEGYPFTTNQHGEERAFIDATVYDRVMPMRIPTVFLIKAILAEDFELADQLGLLEVTPEDFALSSFIDPSKIEMVDIVRKGLHRYSKEMGY